MNQPFSREEIHKIIDSLPSNKSPGPDGFTGDYYKTFKQISSPYLESTFNAAAASATFPPQMLNAKIVTLPKPGKDPSSPPNFRPISLLNIDLKVYAKLIAACLLDILPLFIHLDETGFTKGRQTSDATRRLTNIIHLANLHKRPSLLLALEAEKAFDHIHWQYMAQVPKRFGFSSPTLSAILALYFKPSAQVLTSGALSKPFGISNGTRQGCPLSPFIFNLLIEPLAIYIRSHPGIRGFPVHNSTHAISLFADDIIMILTDAESSLASAHLALDLFNKLSITRSMKTNLT